MSPLPKLMAALVVLTLVAAACEHAPLSSLEPKVVDDTAETSEDEGAFDPSAPVPATPQAGCGLDGFPGDPEFAALLCDYQPILPQATSPTVADVTDSAFDCMARAGELLQEAFQREAIGGVIIPQMEAWELAFDEAALLAQSGDLIAATNLVCELNLEMEAVLFQN